MPNVNHRNNSPDACTPAMADCDQPAGEYAAGRDENPRRGPHRAILAAGFRAFGLLCLVGAALAGTSSLAAAAEATASAAIRQVGASCQEEVERFCPWSRENTAGAPAMDPHDAFICLRVYKTSLSLNCRRAVTAASH